MAARSNAQSSGLATTGLRELCQIGGRHLRRLDLDLYGFSSRSRLPVTSLTSVDRRPGYPQSDGHRVAFEAGILADVPPFEFCQWLAGLVLAILTER